MRVTHLVPALFGSKGVVGGAERFAYELARHMASETPTRLVTFGPNDENLREGDLAIRIIGKPWYVRGQRTNPIAWGLWREWRSADAIHCHQRHVLASSATALFRRATARRTYVTDLGGGGWDISAHYNNDHWFDAHLHLSDYSRRGYGHQGKSFAHVIYAGVDIEKFAPAEMTERAPSVLFVGRILPHKGIDVLIRALPDALSLDVVGAESDPRYLDDLRRLADGKRVRFRLNCGDDDLVAAYRRAICLVLPSVTRTMYGVAAPSAELLGQTLLEAMACGTPVIGSDVGGMPEVVAHGINGFITPAGDAVTLAERLRWIQSHPDEARQMGAAGRARVLAQFTWPLVVKRCLDIYRQCG